MSTAAISDLLAVPATAAYFSDDQAAIKAGATADGLAYHGQPLTPGFTAIRSPAGAVSIMLVLDDGYVAHGDCVSVQYSGVGGREPRLDPDSLAAVFADDVAPVLRGVGIDQFRPTLELLDRLSDEVEGFGTAAAYGLSQALLDAAAHSAGSTMADVIRGEWEVPGALRPVPVFAQCGEERYRNVDKMILKAVDSLPHGLINAPTLVGESAEILIDYVGWVRDRVIQLRDTDDYAPILHFDVYGLIGTVCRGDLSQIAAVITAMADAARPFALRVEHPFDAGDRDAQIREFAALRALFEEQDVRAEIVADEWANTLQDIRAFNQARAAHVIQIKAPDLGAVHHIVDAVLDCRRHGVVAHIGGSCCETDRSAQVSVHLALGADADQLLAKPGMGVDEGLSIVRNEMQRALALTHALNKNKELA
jgi:methylaspartate ammonia-lyase